MSDLKRELKARERAAKTAQRDRGVAEDQWCAEIGRLSRTHVSALASTFRDQATVTRAGLRSKATIGIGTTRGSFSFGHPVVIDLASGKLLSVEIGDMGKKKAFHPYRGTNDQAGRSNRRQLYVQVAEMLKKAGVTVPDAP